MEETEQKMGGETVKESEGAESAADTHNTSESRVEKAVTFYKSGYNCAQAVFCAYSDIVGMDGAEAFRLAFPFGGGLGGMRHLCGTVSAISMLAGMKYAPENPDDREGRKAGMDGIKNIVGEFETECGSVICRRLRGMEPGLAGGKSPRPCVEYVRTAAALAGKLLAEK